MDSMVCRTLGLSRDELPLPPGALWGDATELLLSEPPGIRLVTMGPEELPLLGLAAPIDGIMAPDALKYHPRWGQDERDRA